jgi:predicted nucleic acid-binding protein
METTPRHPEAAALAQGGASVAALDLTLYEVVNAVGRQYRLPAQARMLVQVILKTCGQNFARMDWQLADETAAVVSEHNLCAYDAAYVAAARRNGWQLVSLDVRDLVSRGLAVTPDAAVYP